MAKKIKQLWAIHYDYTGKVYRTKIATGNSGDFAQAVGFQVIDVIPYESQDDRDAGSDETIENGTYPIMLEGETKNIEGKLKTLADATFTNKDQREAFKSMISEILWSNFTKRSEDTRGMYHESENNQFCTYMSSAKTAGHKD